MLPEVRELLDRSLSLALVHLSGVLDGTVEATTKERTAAARIVMDYTLPKPQAERDTAPGEGVLAAIAAFLEGSAAPGDP